MMDNYPEEYPEGAWARTADYKVRWEIDLSASSPEQAARLALEICRDPLSTATVFTVTGPDGAVTIDLGAVYLSPAEVTQLETALDEPPKVIPGLRELLAEPAPWDDETDAASE